MHFLRQSTASQVVRIGPFVDDTDFKTAKAGLTIANTDLKLYKGNAATTETNKNSGGATHVAAGRYQLTLDATDTSALGRLDLYCKMSGALEVWAEYEVLPANVYDSLFLGTDLLDANASQLGGTAQTGRDVGASVLLSSGTGTGQVSLSSGTVTLTDGSLSAAKFAADALARMGVIGTGTAQSASATGVVLASADAYADNVLIGMTILVFGSTQGYWQSRVITDNALTGDAVTVDTWTVTPSGTITYIILGTPPGSTSAPVPSQVVAFSAAGLADLFDTDSGTTYASAVAGSVVKEIADNAAGGGLDAAGVRAAVGLATANLDTQLSGIQSDTDNIQTRIPAALVSGRIDASVGAMAANVLTATAIAADAITDAKVASDVTIASVTGAVGSVTGAVGSVTGNVGGNVTGSVGSVATGGISAGSFAAGAIDAAAIAANAIGASELAADAVTEIAAGVLAAATAAPIAADLKAIDGTTVTGDGSVTPWGP